jgi:hypothetical protein
MPINKPLRYYTYISDVKTDMLLAQIPESTTSRLAAKMKCDIGILSAELELRARSPANRVLRLEAVLQYLQESNVIGTISMPDRWVHGTGRFQWARLGPPLEGYVAVLGPQGDSFVVLVGSAHHLVGGISPPSAGKVALSGDPEVIAHAERLMHEMATIVPRLERGTDSQATALPHASAIERIAFHSTTQNMEFLAFVYEHGPYYGISPQGSYETMKRSVFGSPLYVALT